MKRWQNVRIALSILLFCIAVVYESAHPERLIRMSLIFICLLVWTGFRQWNDKRAVFSGGDVILLLLLEDQSRYLVNYFFHFLWFIMLIELMLNQSSRRTLNIFGVLIALAGLSKFAVALYHIQNARTVSELLFNFGAFAFFLILGNYNAMLQKEQQRSKRLSEELQVANSELREYASTIKLTATLSERTRIAGEIHDTLGHHLTSLVMELEVIKSKVHTSEQAELLQEAATSARQALRETRRAVETLAQLPADDNKEVQKMIQSFAVKNGVKVSASLANIKLPASENLVMYRMIQEALTNAVRHGDASKILIKTSYDQGLFSIVISDNGIGGCPEPGFGLKNMAQRVRELGGDLVISDKPFTITARWQTGGEQNKSISG